MRRKNHTALNADLAWRGMAKSSAAAPARPASGRTYRAVLLRGAGNAATRDATAEHHRE